MAKPLSREELQQLKNGTWSGINSKNERGLIENQEFYDLITNLYSLHEKYKGKTVIATLFQLAPDLTLLTKAFSLKYKTVARENCKVEIEYLIRMNASYWNCGKYYEIDEAATEENQAKREKQNTSRAEFAKKKVKASTALMEAVVEVVETKGPKKVEAVYGVDKEYELYEDVDPEEKDNYIFIGTEEECNKYITDNKPAATKQKTVYGVDKDGVLWKGVLPEDEKDYIKVGTNKECKDYIKANFPKK